MTEPKGAHLAADHTTIVINQMSIQDKDVAGEAQRWTTGDRGEIVKHRRTLIVQGQVQAAAWRETRVEPGFTLKSTEQFERVPDGVDEQRIAA